MLSLRESYGGGTSLSLLRGWLSLSGASVSGSNNGDGGQRSSASLNQKWLKSLNNIGSNEVSENIVTVVS